MHRGKDVDWEKLKHTVHLAVRFLDDVIEANSYPFPEVAGKQARLRLEEMSMSDLIYSFGTSHPGAISLQNYPVFLQKLETQGSGRVIGAARNNARLADCKSAIQQTARLRYGRTPNPEL